MRIFLAGYDSYKEANMLKLRERESKHGRFP